MPYRSVNVAHPMNPAVVIFPPSRRLERTASAPARRAAGRSPRHWVRWIAWSHCVRTLGPNHGDSTSRKDDSTRICPCLVGFPLKGGDSPIVILVYQRVREMCEKLLLHQFTVRIWGFSQIELTYNPGKCG